MKSLFDSQRKETLLKEFRMKDKNNKFVDRRFGEYDNKITPEEKILQRFTLERQVTHLIIIIIIITTHYLH